MLPACRLQLDEEGGGKNSDAIGRRTLPLPVAGGCRLWGRDALSQEGVAAGGLHAWWSCAARRFLYFYIFQNHFLQKYIFDFRIYRFITMPPGRGVAGGLPPVYRTDGPLYAIKTCVLLHEGPYRPAGGR